MSAGQNDNTSGGSKVEGEPEVEVITFEGDALRRLQDSLAADIVKEHGQEALDALDAGSNHPFTCRCLTCLRWWAHCGPEWEDENMPAGYGPFTKDEVNGEQRRLGIEVTP